MHKKEYDASSLKKIRMLMVKRLKFKRQVADKNI